MNSFFRRLPLPFKLMLIGLVPLIFLIYLTAGLYMEKDQKLILLGNYIENIHVSVNLSRLIDNLQQERQFSYDYVLKEHNRDEMLMQRPKVDSIIKLLETGKDSSLKEFQKYSFLKNLHDTRIRIDSNKISANTVMHFYSSTIFRLNTLNGVLPRTDVVLRHVYDDMVSQKLISEMITYSGIINANVYNLLDSRQYIVETLMGTFPSYEVLKSYEEELIHKATPKIISTYNQIRNGSLKPTNDYLENIFKTFKVDSSYNSKQWNELSMKGLNDLRSLQMNLLHDVENGIINIYEKEKRAKTQALVSLVLALALVMGLVIYSIFVINTMLHEIKNAALKIARGESGIELRNMPGDVMGNVALSISKIDRNYKELAEAAKSIGEGDFETKLKPRSENDLLVNALQQMKQNLQQSAQETEASREQFRQLADFVPQMVWTAEPNGSLDYYNKQWYEYTGFPISFGDQSWIPILHPEDVKKCVDTWYDSVHSGKPYEIEYRFKDRINGGYKWFLGRAVPVRNAEGRIVKWFGTCTDIHERKSMSENLESLVKERTEELERSNDDLQQF
ncbi:MAG: PAS domain-containing protein, partial [Flavisolibacter sp.]